MHVILDSVGANFFLGTAAATFTREHDILVEFLTLLTVCYTIIPKLKDGKIHYQASSPDKAALIAGAELLGLYATHKPKSIFVDVLDVSQEFQILNVCKFNSTCKHMSTIDYASDGHAGTIIFERLSKVLEDYVTEGLRTLCITYCNISESKYKQWSAINDQAASTINVCVDTLNKATKIIEHNMFLLSATRPIIPSSLTHPAQVWVLTSDRQETVINIGMSCRLITESMNMATHSLSSLCGHATSLIYALKKELSKMFLKLAVMCKAIICCHMSPLQKALVVKLVKKNQKSILLTISNSANDISMIQAAHVGIGISSIEGFQVACSADIIISQFYFLKKLLLVHRTWSYQCLSGFIMSCSPYSCLTPSLQFSFFNNFLSQIAYGFWTLSLYNIVFTVLLPLVIGVFDQFVSARILHRYS
ncbi:P-type ATPase [Heterobasidion irregulare TC 32-1]|uniref:P-type ATPase n=1 Tax=Heterobasidion irregulare (strain TC 32-1) TaxID=747525 RepID=W4JXJ6_HETIT|nr:P-type ATPase [Heterobasidion irregulare TC 32-1]ETW78277.1 P-type ATPase [Heterobasidion irregulare TC 32-1]